MAVQHMVWIKFNANTPQTRIDHHLAALGALRTKVPGITHLSVGQNFTDRANGFTHGLLVTLESKSALETYATHPEHVPVATALKEDATLMAMDYEFNN
ncbi:Dabb family protein [Poriferisphaera sp. WC338]|uniref:Dabb family protein n=1 Tax=Poriferisphaera sp. WC338 TaxID=3425129 RepID=UPI003D81BA19